MIYRSGKLQALQDVKTFKRKVAIWKLDTMGDSEKTYYFIDMNITTMMICEWGVSQTATHTGDTENPDIHRIFLPKGQYNKLVRKLKQLSYENGTSA